MRTGRYLGEDGELFRGLCQFVLWNLGFALEDGEGLCNSLEAEQIVPAIVSPLTPDVSSTHLFAATSILRTGRSATPFTTTGLADV